MTDAAKNFIETYERERNTLPAAGLGWLDARRDAALKDFAEAGLPHRRLEDWRYTDLRQALERTSLASEPRDHILVGLPHHRDAMNVFNGTDCYRIVFYDGWLNIGSVIGGKFTDETSCSLEANLDKEWARQLIEMPFHVKETGGIVPLNTMLMRDGVALHLKKGAKLDKPLYLVFLRSRDGASNFRHLIRLEEGAEATIFETHIETGDDDDVSYARGKNYFSNHVSNISLARDARLVQIKIQDENVNSIHLASNFVGLDERSHYSSFTMTLGAGLSRGQSFIRFNGEGAEAHVNGATALRGHQHGDQFCIVDHAVPNCASATLFRTVLDDAATGVFQGKVIVRPDAQKTDGRQMTNALLLSRDAAMNAKPELEIYADDVQCAHGSTIGELNREALFYLRSRGIDEETARQLLISAFLDAAFETVPHEAAQDALRELAAGWFRLGAPKKKAGAA